MSAFIVPALYMAGLASVLAVIILIAERYLMDYGEVELTVNEDKRFIVKGGNTLLNTLKEQKIYVPSACGGRATCAYCKVKALSGFSEVLPTESPLLTTEEMAEGVRLSCQIKLKSNAAIEIPEELFLIKEFRASVEAIEDLTYDIKEFRFKLADPDVIEYKAGQYIQFQAPEYGECDESVFRAYSMCGLPADKDCVDLMVRYVPEGICTTYMFNYLKQGDEVSFTGPYGDFYLRDNDRRMICIAGGSGMAPIRSILFSMTPEQVAVRKPIFFFGARAKKDLFKVDEWREFERQHPDFTFVPSLSRPDPEDEWDGEVGRVTDVIEKYFDDLSDAEAYLCGSPGMLDACVIVLNKLGIPDDRIHYPEFSPQGHFSLLTGCNNN